MKRILLNVFFSLSVTILPGQSVTENADRSAGEVTHKFRDGSISIAPNLIFNTSNGTQLGGGLKLRFFLTKRISFNSDAVFSRDYAHFELGLIGLPLWYLLFQPTEMTFTSNTFNELLAKLAFMILSAEHVAYNIPVTKCSEISPYVSLLRFKNVYEPALIDSPDDDGFQGCFATGIEYNRYFGKFILSPYVEYNVGYSDHISGFNAGVYCGFYFPSKR